MMPPRTLTLKPEEEARRLYLKSREGLLDDWYPIQRHYDDGVEIARWKLALREGLPVSSVIIDQLQAAGWEVWDRVMILKSNHGIRAVNTDGYAGLSFGVERNNDVSTTLSGIPLGLPVDLNNLPTAKVVWVRNEYALFHGYVNDEAKTAARLTFTADTSAAQMLIWRGR